ncbi:MAG: AAA family ATPase [Acidimicrobiales bacterium]|nr:AAA family ATPase [Acidimicrobiales bacterium]
MALVPTRYSAQVRYRFESCILDLATRELRVDDEPIHLERQVFDVLEVLVNNADRVVGKAELLDTVWGDQFVSESALTSRIKSARQALGDDGRAQRCIKTVHGVGYRFVAPLTADGTAASTSPAIESAGFTPTAQPNVALTIGIDDEFPFVGRAEETDRLWTLLDGKPGRSAVGLIGGEAGVGKSRFAIEIAQRAAVEFGAVVGAGRCDREVVGHLQAWRDVVHQLATANPDDFARWCVGIEATIATLGPAVARLLGQPVVDVTVDEHSASEAIVSLLDRVGTERPTVVVIDDLHWSDEPTRATISLVLRRLAHRPVVILTTFRTSGNDLGSDVDLWLAELGRSIRVERLDLSGLSQLDVINLGRQVLDSEDSQQIHDLFVKTGGHGLFVIELLREIHRGGASGGLPPSITALVRSRVDRLSADAQSLVMAGATLGVEFRIGTAASVAGLRLVDALSALDTAIRADLIHEGTTVERYRFSHQLVPAALLEGMTAPGRAALHHRAVSVLDEEDAPRSEVAMHLLDSVPLTPRDEAIAVARHVATNSFALRYYDEALRLLDRVLKQELDEQTRAEVELQLGAVLNDAGRVPDAIPIFDRAADRARATDRPDLLVAAAFGRAGRSPYRRVIDTGTLELLTEIEDLVDLDHITRARAQARTAAFQLNWWRLAEREELSAKALAAGREAGAGGLDLLELLEARWIAVGCPAGAGLLDEIDLEMARLRFDVGVTEADAAMPETAALWFARGDRFRAEANRFATPDEHRRNIDYWRNDVLNGAVALFEGRFDEARVRFDEASYRGRGCWGESGPVLHAFSHLCLDALTGSSTSAEMLDAVAREIPSPIIYSCQAWAQVLSGDLAQARTTFQSVAPSSLDWFPEHLVGGIALVAAAETAVAFDNAAMTAAVSEQLEPLGSLMLGLPWAPSFAAADSLALLAHHRRDSAAEDKWRQQAIGLYETLGAPALTAHLERF